MRASIRLGLVVQSLPVLHMKVLFSETLTTNLWPNSNMLWNTKPAFLTFSLQNYFSEVFLQSVPASKGAFTPVWFSKIIGVFPCLPMPKSNDKEGLRWYYEHSAYCQQDAMLTVVPSTCMRVWVQRFSLISQKEVFEMPYYACYTVAVQVMCVT